MLSACDPKPQQNLCLAPFPLSRFCLLTSFCVCPWLSLGPQGQAYSNKSQATQSEQCCKACGAKGPKATLWVFQGSLLQVSPGLCPHAQVCAAGWRTSGLVSPERIPVYSVAFCSAQEVVMVRKITPTVISLYVVTHQGRCVPKH